jgi:hypothetical protein
MSIYINLRSSECRDIYPNNHGGNFKIELNEPLRLHGAWEVALAEMTYHSQSFPNLPKEHNTVEVYLKEPLEVYDTRNLDLYIRTYVIMKDRWQYSDYFEIEYPMHFPSRLDMPKKNYSWEDFKTALENLTKLNNENRNVVRITNVNFKFDKNEKLTLTFHGHLRAKVVFSADLVKFLSLDADEAWQAPNQVTNIHKIEYIKPTLSKELATTRIAHNADLGHNYYPTARSLIDALNSLVSQSTSVLNSKPIDRLLFNLNLEGKCTFMANEKFGVTLSPYLLKLLQLKNTDTNQIGTSFCVMPAALREFLYIYSDMLDTHSYSNESNVLRVINNDTTGTEKVMIPFANLYYYPISARYLSNIQIRITDNFSDVDLPFIREVTCLLHFRRCSNSHSL